MQALIKFLLYFSGILSQEAKKMWEIKDPLQERGKENFNGDTKRNSRITTMK